MENTLTELIRRARRALSTWCLKLEERNDCSRGTWITFAEKFSSAQKSSQTSTAIMTSALSFLYENEVFYDENSNNENLELK